VQDRMQNMICYGSVPEVPVLHVFVCPDVADISFSLERAVVQYRTFTDEGMFSRPHSTSRSWFLIPIIKNR